VTVLEPGLSRAARQGSNAERAIDETVYLWHQPEDLVTWDTTALPRLGRGSSQWLPAEEEKPVYLLATQFAEAKDLLRFVLEGSEGRGMRSGGGGGVRSIYKGRE
jgi:hypothetical protein